MTMRLFIMISALVAVAYGQGAAAVSPGPAEATLIPVGNFSPEVLQLCNITEVPDIDPSVIDFLGERQTFTTENSEVSYHRFGNTTSDRPAIVLVNGFTNTQLSWPLDLLAALAEDQEVITFDNRGIGYSKDFSSAPLSVLGLTNDTIGLIDGLGLEKPNLLGWSLGGMITLSATALFGEKINKAIVIAGTPGGPSSPSPDQAVVANLASPQVTIPFFEALFPLLSPEVVEVACDYSLNSVGALAPVNVTTIKRQAQALGAYFASDNATAVDEIPDITNDVLLVTGDQDLIVPNGGLRNAVAEIEHVQLVVYRNAGHAAWVQYLPSLLDTISIFLDTPDFPDDVDA